MPRSSAAERKGPFLPLLNQEATQPYPGPRKRRLGPVTAEQTAFQEAWSAESFDFVVLYSGRLGDALVRDLCAWCSQQPDPVGILRALSAVMKLGGGARAAWAYAEEADSASWGKIWKRGKDLHPMKP